MLPTIVSSTLETANSSQKSDRASAQPSLWVSQADDHIRARYEKDFQIYTLADEPQPGHHVIALQSERDIRQALRKLQRVENHDIRIFPAELLPFETSIQILLKGQPVERWVEVTKDQPLSLADALDMAEDILIDATISSKQRNIELEELRRRCGVTSFDWNKFISDLERDLHASVDAKKLNDRHERVRLELQSLLKETDPLKALDAKKFIAQRYGYKISEIEQLLRYLDQSSKLPKPRSLSLDELFSLPHKGDDYLIPGMLPAGECVLLVASPKAGKSLLAYDAAFAVATGEDTFLGEAVKQGKVLIIQCDESIGSATRRLMKRGFRKEDSPNVQFMDSFNIFQLPELEERLESFQPNLVVLDSVRRISMGTNISENSAEFADAVYKFKELLFRYNAAGILIHHTNKNQEALGVERVRGSSAIAGAVWGVWELSHIPKPDPNNKKKQIIDPKDPTRVLSITARDIEGQRLKIELDPENNHWVSLGEDGVDEGEVANRKSHEAKILELLKSVAPKGLEASEINEHFGLGRGVYCYLNRLLGKGVIGSRPSSTDRRRTVYFFPQPEVDHKIDRTQEEDVKSSTNLLDPPSPPVCVSEMRSTSESVDMTGLENRSQIDRKLIAQDSLNKPVSTSDAEQVSPSSVDRKNRAPGGGRESTESVIDSKESPITEGSCVGKRVLMGWSGEVRKIQGDIAIVHWHGDYNRNKAGRIIKENGKPVEKLTRVPLGELVLRV